MAQCLKLLLTTVFRWPLIETSENAASKMSNQTVTEPLPIFTVAGRYFIYDVDTVIYIRRQYNMCGVLIGNIPQVNQQNVFSGIPLQLMPEEARLLVENGHAHIVHDAPTHLHGMQNLSLEERQNFRDVLVRQGFEVGKALRKQAQAKKELGLMKQRQRENARVSTEDDNNHIQNPDDLLFDTPATSSPSRASSQTSQDLKLQLITPTTSYPPLTLDLFGRSIDIPAVPSSYPLFAHLNSKGYFITPGLRFGCQYCAYPGDPLRFHSHFLATSHGWDDEIDLLDIVGGGRLGTGVKKGYLIGGMEPEDGSAEAERKVRTFCLEWAVM